MNRFKKYMHASRLKIIPLTNGMPRVGGSDVQPPISKFERI
jgi:hypothetical protein